MRTYPATYSMELHGEAVAVPELPALPTPDQYDTLREANSDDIEWDALTLRFGGQDEEDYWILASINLLNHPDPLRPDNSKSLYLLPDKNLQELADEPDQD